MRYKNQADVMLIITITEANVLQIIYEVTVVSHQASVSRDLRSD